MRFSGNRPSESNGCEIDEVEVDPRFEKLWGPIRRIPDRRDERFQQFFNRPRERIIIPIPSKNQSNDCEIDEAEVDPRFEKLWGPIRRVPDRRDERFQQFFNRPRQNPKPITIPTIPRQIESMDEGPEIPTISALVQGVRLTQINQL